MPRSMALFQSQGLTPIAAPMGFTPWHADRWDLWVIPNQSNLSILSVALHEIFGLTWGRMTGDIT